MTKYKLTLFIGIHNACQEDYITIEEMGFTEQEWNALTDENKNEILQENWNDWSNNFIDGGWELVE